VNYTWYQNAVLIYNSDSLIVLHSDPDMAPGTSSLEIVDMKFHDQATYSCVANFPGSTVPELRVDVNITQNSGKGTVPLFCCHVHLLLELLDAPSSKWEISLYHPSRNYTWETQRECCCRVVTFHH
jgi:hypothetical protein